MNAGFAVMDFQAIRFYYITFIIDCVSDFATYINNFLVFPNISSFLEFDLSASCFCIDDLLQFFRGHGNHASAFDCRPHHMPCLLFRVDRQRVFPVFNRLSNGLFCFAAQLQLLGRFDGFIVRISNFCPFPLLRQPCSLAEIAVFRVQPAQLDARGPRIFG